MANISERHLGCEAGLASGDTPACLGGTAIRGCNNPEDCLANTNPVGYVNYVVRQVGREDLVEVVYEVRKDPNILRADIIVPGLV